MEALDIRTSTLQRQIVHRHRLAGIIQQSEKSQLILIGFRTG